MSSLLNSIDQTLHFLSKPDCPNKHISPNFVDAISRLKQAFKQYCNCDIALFDFDNIDITTLLNDFLYLLSQHNQDEFWYIHDVLNGYCNIHNCAAFKRNYRNRDENMDLDLYRDIDSAEDVSKCQIMDKIHCFLCTFI